MDRKKKYALDILLRTQGWSRYDWEDISGTKPNALNRFENGITISGRVNRPASGVKRIFLYTTKNHPAKFIDLDKDQKFELSGLFLEEDEEVRFSYISTKGTFERPSMYLRFLVTTKEDKISEGFLSEVENIATTTADFTIPKDFFYEKAEALDEVVLKGEKKKKEYKDAFLLNPEVTEITMEEYTRYLDLVQFLNFNGFNASENMGRVSISSRIARGGTPAVFFNGVRLQDFSILSALSLANIERIVTDRYSVVPTTTGKSLGVIKIFTRTTPLFQKGGKGTVYLSTKSTEAFKAKKEYYSPNYASYLNPVFQKFGTISWIPTLELNKETPTSFKIYDTYTKNVTLFIEGISENGDLISERKTIQVR
jgi:hypothetical protein